MYVEFWPVLTVAALVCSAMFFFTWLLSLRLNNYSFVDVAWAYALGILAPLYAFMGDGWPPRQMLACGLAVAWSGRLGTYLLFRVARHHPKEDVRYAFLRESWKGRLAFSFLWFFQAQALSILLLSVPILLSCLNPVQSFEPIELIGVIVWLIGIGGESLADAQMAAFKRESRNKDAVCKIGLWRYSRHPNYFFEFVIWIGFWLFACGSNWGWVTVYAPALILFFLLRVTGIPLTEKCSVESKGDAYREYQRTTSAFVPWFSKGK